MFRPWTLLPALIVLGLACGLHFWHYNSSLAAAPAPAPGAKCETETGLCLTPCKKPPAAAASAGYWPGGEGYLGLSYGLGFAFLAYVVANFVAGKGGSLKSLLASGGLAGGLWLGLCWLVGCCGSPLLPLYISLFGTKFLGVTGPAALGLTALSVAVGAAWFHHSLAKGCACAACAAAGESGVGGEVEVEAGTLFEKLRAWLKEERCLTCECLQGGLVQVEMDGGERGAQLVAAYRLPAGKMHPCLGCEPCPPAAAHSQARRFDPMNEEQRQ